MTRRRGKRHQADWRDGAGKRHRPSFPTAQQAREAEDEGRREARRSRSGNAWNPTLAEYAKTWLEGKRAFLKPSSFESYESSLRLHVLPNLGDKRLREITVVMVIALLGGKIQEGLGRKSAGTVLVPLRALLSDARKRGLTLGNPASALGRELNLWATGRERTETIRALDAEQLARLLTAARELGEDVYDLLFTMSRTAVRLGELLGLQFGDFDFVKREIRVSRAWNEKGIVETPKSGHGRTVDLAASVSEIVRGRMMAAARDWMASGQARGEMPDWVFRAPGRWIPWAHERVRAAFNRSLRRAGLPHFTPHSLRHTFASLLLADGVSPAYVQEQLGHASIALTIGTYGRWLRKRAPGALDKVLDGLGTGVGTEKAAALANQRDAGPGQLLAEKPRTPVSTAAVDAGKLPHGILDPEGGMGRLGLRSRLAAYWRLPPEERRVVPRALLLVAFARLAVPRAGVTRTRRAVARLAPRSAISSRRLAVLVAAAARVLPGAGPCLPRAIALEALLLGAGRAAELRIGVAPRSGRGRLDTHAWVEVEGVALDEDSAPYVALPLFGTRT